MCTYLIYQLIVATTGRICDKNEGRGRFLSHERFTDYRGKSPLPRRGNVESGTLLSRGLNKNRISRKLGIDCGTVRQYQRKTGSMSNNTDHRR